MDETQSSRVSDAAATRKRRSSILKQQRAPRTPFSELEFNVATPTDAGKSRRVSFSRRMGVAEFVTNEGTTTWKNFYEEHNKSLESSGNESGANARPSVSHIGKRLFDQQFEEVEAVDFGSALIPGNSRAAEFNISINNVNLTQQLAALECSVGEKLAAPHQHFELSSLTEHQTKVFSDDLTIPGMGEMSNQINVNFSIINPVGNSDDKCDDLDEIQKDLKRSHNVVGPGLFREQNMSEYIEVDLNMTHIAVVNEQSDMSITDTIHSPKVQDVSSSISLTKIRTPADDKDWTTDKENIAIINPYISPNESDNFAINDEPNQVLVFDGKRLTVHSEPQEKPVRANDFKGDTGNYRQTLLPDAPMETNPQRKTIVLNINDDLPNFSDKPVKFNHQDLVANAKGSKHTMIFDEGDLSMTQAVPNIIELSNAVQLSTKEKTFARENMTGNISFTQAVPSNVIIDNNVATEKEKTIIYDSSYGNISVTHAIPRNVLLEAKTNVVNQRRTTVYDENLSFTEVAPKNLIIPENNEKSTNRTIVFQNNMEDISFTQVIPNIIQLEKPQMNKTTVFEKSVCNISMTQALPSNVILFENELASNKRKTIVFENDDANISMTQAIPANLIISKKPQGDEIVNKRETAIFENDTGDISLTQAIPANILQPEIPNNSEFDIGSHEPIAKFPHDDREDEKYTMPTASEDISIHNNRSKRNKRLTIMYDENADISVTQALPTNIMSANQLKKSDQKKSVAFNNECCNISVTKEFPGNIPLKEGNGEKLTSVSFLCKNQDVSSVTRIISNVNNSAIKGIVIDNDKSNASDKSINEIQHKVSSNMKEVIDMKNKDNYEIGNLSITKPIPNKIFDIENEILKADMEKFTDLTQYGEKTLLQDSVCHKSNVDILVYQAETRDISEKPLNNIDHDDILDEESTKSIGVQKKESTIEKSIKSVSATDNTSIISNLKDVEMQIDLQNEKEIVSGNNVEAIETANSEPAQDVNKKKSILHELLDMSSTSIGDDVSDKNVIAKVDPEVLPEKSIKSSETNSNDAIFLITGDSDENVQTDDIKDDKDLSTVGVLKENKLHEIENKLPALECNITEDNNLEDKLIQLTRSTFDQKKESPPQNRHYEKIVSSDLQQSDKQSNVSDVKDIRIRKSFKEADDTKELLEILSDFTDRKSGVPLAEDDKVMSQSYVRKSIDFENKAEMPEPNRSSFVPNRKSIVLTREEFVKNLAITKATQKCFDVDDSEMEDTAIESPPETNGSTQCSPRKSVRMSSEVVKTLHFEDESASDVSLISGLKTSLLKKTAFGESSYMKECKANVIPTYLKDVSDNLKALMHDLVKPRPDQMPYDVICTPKAKKDTSTCSTQIQANLTTSSQIDLDVELHSNVNSSYELGNAEPLKRDIAEMGNKAVVRALQGNVSAVTDVSEMNGASYAVKYFDGKSSLKKSSQEPVLFFDRNNPLNNVLLGPPNCVFHKYNPEKSSEAIRAEENASNPQDAEEAKNENQGEVERVTTQYHVANHVGLPSGDSCHDKKGDSHTLFSDPSKPLSMDRSTEGFAMEVKHTEVNTVIVMKGNKELLEASSSLTLVDDALAQNIFDIEMKPRSNNQNSPVKVIYKMNDEDDSMLENVDSDFVSNDDEPMDYKAKKRSYSPTRDLTRPSTISSPDVTPKPVSKMQKMSTSPVTSDVRRVPSEKSDRTDSNSDTLESHRKRPRKPKSSPKIKRPGTDVTVQQLIAQFKISKMDQDLIEDQIIEAIHDRVSSSRSHSPDGLSSCTSSKNQSEMREPCVKETVSYVGSQPSRVDWQPELKELGSRNVLTECDSGVNVVAKIDMLPFMGSRECEWETSGGDTWVFRVLRARLRLRVRLAHRHHNALRTRVRADTPVADVGVDIVPVEEKDPLTVLCVRFAAEAMRYEAGRGCARAGDVPLLLRRCGGVARVALRWARAMRDARVRLAYTLTEDGDLTLKVANVLLRCVWEVGMRLELVVQDAREAAWPRAGELRVRRVLADYDVPPEETARVLAHLAHDWGHVPRTIWKIFRYLKNKTRDDNFLQLGSAAPDY